MLYVPRYAFRCRRDILVSIPVNRHGCLSAALDLNPTRKEKKRKEKKKKKKKKILSYNRFFFLGKKKKKKRNVTAGCDKSFGHVDDEAFLSYEMAPCRCGIDQEYATMSPRECNPNYRS